MFCSGNYKFSVFKSNQSAKIITVFVLFCLFFQSGAQAQNTQETVENSAAPTPTAAPTSIPFSDIITQSDQATSTLTQLAASSAAVPSADAVERALPALTDEINAKSQETSQLIESRPTLEKLRSFETDWRALGKNLPQWKNDLTEGARRLETNLAQLGELQKKWQATAGELTNGDTPPEISAKVQNILSTIGEIRPQIEAQRARFVSLQTKVAEQQKRIDSTLGSIRQSRNALVGQLLVQDNPPIWSRELWTDAQTGAWREAIASFTAQVRILNDFVNRNTIRIVIHLLIFAVFAGILIFLRRRAHLSIEKDKKLQKAAVIFYLPISTALILAILFSSRIYPQTPQLLSTIFGAIVLLPTIIILRKLVERPLYPVLYSLVVFYFLDLLRTVIDSEASIARIIFLIEMLGGFIFFLWLRRKRLTVNLTDKIRGNRVFQTFRFVATIALPIFAIAFLADAFGYVSLAQLLGNAVLRSSYVALILYAIVRIADGLVIFALRFRPLCLLKMVEKYRSLIQKRVRKFLRWIAIIAWILITLEFLNLREPFFEKITAILTAKLNVGSISISLGDLLLFGITVWLAFLLSRFVRFALEEDVYPRVPLERGLPYAISTLLNYTILLIGFFLAVGAAGFDLTKFTILAGAFGVGIGFGLQNIINNFVSGLILLFERPIKVGDLVKIGDATGTIKNIGIRASIVHIWDNSDIIVPNSKLISDNVTNWTFSSQQRGIEMIFSIPPGATVQPKKIIEIMEKSAEKNPLVSETPMPQVLFNEISFDRLTFKLRVWTAYFDKVLKIRSDLVLNISEALNAENIPHEQLDSEEKKSSESSEQEL